MIYQAININEKRQQQQQGAHTGTHAKRDAERRGYKTHALLVGKAKNWTETETETETETLDWRLSG